MSKLLLASLIGLVSSGVATADRAPTPPPPTPPSPPAPRPNPSGRCAVGAAELATVIHRGIDAGDPLTPPTESKLVILTSGLWTYAVTDTTTKRHTREVSSCLEVPELDALRAALKAATWKTTPNAAHCMAVSAHVVDYTIGGKVVWSAEVCPSVSLDAASTKAITALDAIDATAAKPDPLQSMGHKPAAPSTGAPTMNPGIRPAPPACSPTGTAIYEYEIVVDGKPAKSQTVSVFSNGAWSRKLVMGTGQPTAVEGCMSPKVLAEIRIDLKAMTWKANHQRITCKAMSPRHVIYRVDGKQMWDAHVCQADALDAGTEQAIADVRVQLAPMVPADQL